MKPVNPYPMLRQMADEIERAAVLRCPPHNWVIVDHREDGYREEQWECRRCGDTKCMRTPTWVSKSGRMSNTSTWTAEDAILGGEDEVLRENEAAA